MCPFFNLEIVGDLPSRSIYLVVFVTAVALTGLSPLRALVPALSGRYVHSTSFCSVSLLKSGTTDPPGLQR